MVEVLSPLGESVSSQDGTAPPVLFVVGTAGAGKSSLVTAFQRWARFLEVDALAINLDPGAEKVDYDTEFDVRESSPLSKGGLGFSRSMPSLSTSTLVLRKWITTRSLMSGS